MSTAQRRPLKTRGKAWAQTLARITARTPLTPNAISFCSILMAAGAAGALWALPCVEAGWQRSLLSVAALAGIQLRLLCNMLDGMVAVEGGKGSPSGDLWNEVPDRIADIMILVAAGLACTSLPYAWWLGWCAAALAMLTAYIRALAASLHCPPCFHGPMAKPHRMFVLSLACLITAVAHPWIDIAWPIYGALCLIIVGSLLTAWRRLCFISSCLRERAAA